MEKVDSSLSKCRVCSTTLDKSFSEAMVLGRKVQYFECAICGYVQTEKPTWLEEAYASPINPSDTGIMARNLYNVELVLASLALIGKRKGKVVDYAGGHGFLVRLLRDKGINALWADLYSENLVARGFEYSNDEHVCLVTAFEAFEHFVNPAAEMERLLSIAPSILLTTTLAPRPTPQPSDWWYYGLEHGQHIGFYRLETLEYLAKKFNLNLLTNGSTTHMFTAKKYSRFAWKILRIIARLSPKLLVVGLNSKTWSDNRTLAKQKGNV